MTITATTRKILWARSGNRCAICRRELVTSQSDIDGTSVIGEECHIVGRKLNGPRGVSSLSSGERDKPENLILLCRNHHKIIDDAPEKFTVDLLKEIKVNHESWVQSSLSTEKSKKETLFFAYRIDNGTQFCNTIIGCDALSYDNPQPETEIEAHLIGDFIQKIQDYTDIWDIMEGKDKVLVQFEVDKQISELDDNGLLVYAVLRNQKFYAKNVSGSKSLNLNIGYVIITRKNNNVVMRKDKEIENVMKLNGQQESEFTNFMPILVNPSSIQFV